MMMMMILKMMMMMILDENDDEYDDMILYSPQKIECVDQKKRDRVPEILFVVSPPELFLLIFTFHFLFPKIFLTFYFSKSF